MFDYVLYEGKEYQTKDTPAQLCDKYKIEHDQDSGHVYLWHEEYDMEFIKDETSLLGVILKQSNERWVCCHDFDGAIDFYREDVENGGYKADMWIQYHSLFMNGQLIKIEKYEKENTHNG